MPSTNDYGPKRVVLYTRVSGDEQKKKGYSLRDQGQALRAWASENGCAVVEEVEDAGYSGAYLERPGLDRVREMVRGGAADAVVVLFRDRIARGVYAQLLAEEFRQHGARLVALNSRGDDSPDGELGDNILDVIAAWERKKIAERMNRGKVRKAREGKIVAGPRPSYGYRFNESRDAYLVDEEKMVVARRIFEMVGAKGMTLNSVRRAFEDERIPSPSGRRRWNRQFMRNLITDDVYLPHTFEEVANLVSPDVASRLDTGALYGVWWYGKERHVYSQERVIGHDGVPQYRKTKKSTPVPEAERVAVPVPDAGIPKDWVLNARRAIAENEWSANAGYKTWELSGGLLQCAECGRAMSVNYIRARGRGYYRCIGRYNGGTVNRCSTSRTLRAEEAEAKVWEFVYGILTNPARLLAGLEKMQDDEADGASAEEEEESWLKQISEIERKKERLLDLYLEGDIATEQFRAKSAVLQEAHEKATVNLEAVRSRRARVEDFERDKEALLEYHARLIPEDLDGLTPEQRQTLYRMMRLRVLARDGALTTAEWGCNVLTTPPDSCRTRGR